jgi:hypothetical protein
MNYGGGVNSTAMFFVLLKNKIPLDEMIFADTGAEMPQTYKTVERMQGIAKQNNILFTIVRSDKGNLYDYCWKYKTVPSRQRRDCTWKFKIRPIRNYIREKYGKEEHFNQYIGISYEEKHRVRLSDVRYATNVYPLIDNKIDRNECIKINKENGFDDTLKSGCYICPFTRKQGWIDLAKNNPELFDKAIALEENCPNKKVQLASKPLRFFKKLEGQKYIMDYGEDAPPCNGTGGCFL